MLQTLSCAQVVDELEARGHPADAAAVDAVLTAARWLFAPATRSPGAAAEETTIAQYRALVALAPRGPRRMVDLAGALDVAPSAAVPMCDRLVRNGLIRRHRARADRGAVLVPVSAVGRRVVDQTTGRRRALIEGIQATAPAGTQRRVAEALCAFADAAGQAPDSQWPPPGSAGEVARTGLGGSARPIGNVRTSAKEGR